MWSARFLDDQFQRLLDALDDMDIAGDTIVVFTSDHGDMHGSHGVYKKRWPWNEALKVPFVLRYPGAVPAAARVEAPLSVIDVMPTLLGLVGLSIPDAVEGIDLSAVLRGEEEEGPESVLIMNPCPFSIGDPRGHDQYPSRGMRLEYRGVVTRRHTYVRTIDQPWLPFDNVDDPHQVQNLVDDERSRDVRERLDGLMRAHMARIGDELMPREFYYERFGIAFDHRGKVVNLVENMYDRAG